MKKPRIEKRSGHWYVTYPGGKRCGYTTYHIALNWVANWYRRMRVH